MALSFCDDIEIKEEEKVPEPTTHKSADPSNEYAKQLEKLLLYQCVQLVNIKVSMQYNTTLQELFSPMSKEARQNYIQKLMLYNIDKCLHTMKSNEFIELLKEKNSNRTHEYVLDRLEVPLKDSSNLQLSEREIELVNKLNTLKKEMDEYNKTKSADAKEDKPTHQIHEADKLESNDIPVSNSLLIIVIGIGVIALIVIAKCLFRNSHKDIEEPLKKQEEVKAKPMDANNLNDLPTITKDKKD